MACISLSALRELTSLSLRRKGPNSRGRRRTTRGERLERSRGSGQERPLVVRLRASVRAPAALLHRRLLGREGAQVCVLRGTDQPSITLLDNNPGEHTAARRSGRAIGVLVPFQSPIDVGQRHVWLEELNRHSLG